MSYIEKFFKHFWMICKHKYWVFYFACKCGIPIRGFFHDFSKFHPTEFFESVKYYTGTKSPIVSCKEDKGYSLAWQHHKGHNPHHYEYWIDNLDNGGTPLIIPFKYCVEMVCDWLAAGKSYQGKNFNYDNEFLNNVNFRKAIISSIDREKLLNDVWGYEYLGDVRTVDVHVRRLREKIEKVPSEPNYIHTKWGVGYFFQN